MCAFPCEGLLSPKLQLGLLVAGVYTRFLDAVVMQEIGSGLVFDSCVNQDLGNYATRSPIDDIYSAVGILAFGISIIPDQIRSLLFSTENRARK